MDKNLVGLLILFVTYAINRFLMTEATKKLDDSDKLNVFEVFSKRSNYSTVFILTIVFLYFGAIQCLPHLIFQITIIYLVLFASYLIFKFSSNYKKLKQMEMPENYIQSFKMSYGIFALGFLSLAFCVLWSWSV